VTSKWKAASNRRNALKSTGSRTAAGREAVRRNALQHGLAAQAVVLEVEGEDAVEFRAMADSHRAAFRPRDEVALQLAAAFSTAARVRMRCEIAEAGMTRRTTSSSHRSANRACPGAGRHGTQWAIFPFPGLSPTASAACFRRSWCWSVFGGRRPVVKVNQIDLSQRKSMCQSRCRRRDWPHGQCRQDWCATIRPKPPQSVRIVGAARGR
jgi:hypothetical protein